MIRTTAIPAPVESEDAAAPAPQRLTATAAVLRLQRSAGNQAVTALLAGQASRSPWPELARQATAVAEPGAAAGDAATTAAPGQITASVGRGGANNPVDVAVVSGLLARAGLDASDVEAAIERYQRDTMGWRHPDARVDPGGKTLRRLNGGSAAAGGGGEVGQAHAGGGGGAQAPAPPAPAGPTAAGPTTAGPTPAGPTPAGPTDAAPEGAEQTFQDFAAGRAPLFAAMSGAADDEARRAARLALREYDAQHLPQLRVLQQQMGGRWNIADPAARDAVLAAIQLEAAVDAEGDLHRNSDEVHRRVARAAGMGLEHAWCGMFTVDHYRHSGMDSDLKSGFLHVNNVHDYFTYRHTRNPQRVPKWIWADRAWHDLRTYHQQRGAERQWLTQSEVSAGGQLDIRPGDAVLIDVGLDGTPNHIVKASSYDPVTSTLMTIGGNDAGFVIDRRPAGSGSAATGDRARAEAETGERMTTERWHGGAAGGHVGQSVHGLRSGAVFGVGRPSIVDFEEHPYDRSGNIRRPPAPLAE